MTKSQARLTIKWLAEEINPGQGPEKEYSESWGKSQGENVLVDQVRESLKKKGGSKELNVIAEDPTA